MQLQPLSTNHLTRRNLFLCAVFIAIYAVGYVFLSGRTGLPGALAILPVIVCGWLLGQWGGLAASFLISLLTVFLIVAFGDGWPRVQETWLGLIVIIFAGGIVGWFRELYDRIRAQAVTLRQAQTDLSRLNNELEARVQARTEEIRRLNTDLELRVAQRTEELTIANAQLDSYNNMVAHDLRAPLTLIQAYGDALRLYYNGKPLDEQGLEMLQGMQEASTRMRDLIQDLFDFSRARDDELQHEAVDLSALACGVIEELKQSASQHSPTVVIAPHLTAQGDARYLRILLNNLLGNAWKYTGKTPEARLEFGAQPMDNSQTFWVRDNGAGIPMTQAARLFQPFQRFNSEFPGTGLGLATCKRIVERHGGCIWAESEVGQGTTIYFKLGTSEAISHDEQ
jgi:signal transduction histidine kinase